MGTAWSLPRMASLAVTRNKVHLGGAAEEKAKSRATGMASVDCLVAVDSDDGLLRVLEGVDPGY